MFPVRCAAPASPAVHGPGAQPVAAVVAQSREQAQDAAELAVIDYEDLPCVTDAVAAIAPDAPLVWPEAGSNVAAEATYGDPAAVEKAFSSAAHVTTLELHNQRLVAMAMEPRACIAVADGGRTTLYTQNQTPTGARELLAAVFRARLGAPSPALRRILIPVGLFALGNATDAFLLLRAADAGIAQGLLPLLWLALHAVKAASSLWGGRLADRMGPRPTIAAGWIVYAVVYALMPLAWSAPAIVVLFLVYGLHHGLTEAPERKLVASIAPPERHGAAFGWYHLTVGLLALPASALFGTLWHRHGATAAFWTGAALAVLATLVLLGQRWGTTPSISESARPASAPSRSS